MEPERLTPMKFTSKHCWASFENGLLVCLKQKYLPNDIGTDVNIFNFGKEILVLYQFSITGYDWLRKDLKCVNLYLIVRIESLLANFGFKKKE